MGSRYFVHAKTAVRLGICPLLASVFAGAAARAAVDDEEIESSSDPVDPRQAVVQERRMLNMLLSQRRSNATRTKHQLVAKLRDLDRACHLSAMQKQKLALAAEGDSKRHDDTLQNLQDQSQKLQQVDLIKRQELIQGLNALQLQSADPFNEESLFGKTLNRLLDHRQLSALALRQTRESYEKLVAENLPALGTRIGLRPEQYPALTELLTWETDPPKKYGRFEYMYLVYQFSKVPADKLKPLLDDRQQARLAQQYVANAEPFLVRIGMLDDQADADDAAELPPADDQPGPESPAQPSEVRR